MGNLSHYKLGDVLPEFQKFLLEKKLTPEKNVFFYALWTSKYFNYARHKQIPSDEYREHAVIEFLEALKTAPNVSDWQIRQAGDAIRLYYKNVWEKSPDGWIALWFRTEADGTRRHENKGYRFRCQCHQCPQREGRQRPHNHFAADTPL